MIIKLKSFSALIAKLLQPLNFLTLSNDQNPAKPRHRPFEQSLFLFKEESGGEWLTFLKLKMAQKILALISLSICVRTMCSNWIYCTFVHAPHHP